MAQPVEPHDLKSDTFVEERLTDGELYLRLEDYLRAAILLTDIVDHYPTHRAYPEALFLLGESLFLAGDYLGARKRYAEVIDRSASRPFSPFLQPSLSRLIEIAIHTRDFDEVDGYFARLEALPSATLSVTTAYFRAKYLYNRAVPVDDVLNAPPNAAIQRVDQAASSTRARASSPSQAAPSSPCGRSTSSEPFTPSAASTSTPSPRSSASSATSPRTTRRPGRRAHLPRPRAPLLRNRTARAGARSLPSRPANLVPLRRGAVRARLDLHPYGRRRPSRARARGTVGGSARQPSQRRWQSPARRPPGADGRYDEAEAVFDEVRATFGPIRDELARNASSIPIFTRTSGRLSAKT